jgi:DegV family protein with EDD domain
MSGFGGWNGPSGMWHSAPANGPARVRVITDSASDILPSHAQAIGLIVVPNLIVMDGAAYRDGIDITASQFYARLPRLRTPPYTQPASVETVYNAYQAAFQQGATDIVSIHVSGRLSKIVQNATAARSYLFPPAIDIIDSRQTGIGMWPAVIRAAQLANLGAPAQVIHETVISILARTRMYAMVESLEPLRRSGRIGRARELVGTILDAHPIITVDQGEVTPVATVRPRARSLARLRELAQEVGEIESLLMCGTSIESIAQFEALFVGHYRGTIQKTWLGPTNGANTGPCIAVTVVAREAQRVSPSPEQSAHFGA